MTTLTPFDKRAHTGEEQDGAWARYLNIGLALWLFLSAFLWRHADGPRVDTWSVAILMYFAAVFALGAPAIRYANSILASWLFLSTLLMHPHLVTALNNLAVASAVFALSVVPMKPKGPRGPNHGDDRLSFNRLA